MTEHSTEANVQGFAVVFEASAEVTRPEQPEPEPVTEENDR